MIALIFAGAILTPPDDVLKECIMKGGTYSECVMGHHIDNPKPPYYWTPEQWKNYREMERREQWRIQCPKVKRPPEDRETCP